MGYPPTLIPFNDVRPQYSRWKHEIDAALLKVIEEGHFEMGYEVDDFERAFARYIGVKHAISVHSGTAALHLSLRALGIGTGDDVITTANPDISTVAAIHHAGARAVFTDIRLGDHNMDPEALQRSITSRTRAIIAVHMFGQPAELDQITEVAQQHSLLVIEDVALATGAQYKGKKVGGFGDTGCFSFAPGKILGAFGWGGMVTTDNDELAYALRLLRAYGADPDDDSHQPDFKVEGWNLRLDTLQAAVLKVKLKFLEQMIEERRKIAQGYMSALSSYPIQLPVAAPHVRHVYRNFVLQTPKRDALQNRLNEQGVPTRTLYSPPLHHHSVYRHLGYSATALPVTDKVAQQLLCLPIYPGMPEEHQDLVISVTTTALAK